MPPPTLLLRGLFCPLSPHGTEYNNTTFGPKWCQSPTKLAAKDTSQGLSVFPLSVAEVWVPNLGFLDAWSKWKESSRGNSPPAVGTLPSPAHVHCGAKHPPSPHPSEPGPALRSPHIPAAASILPTSPNLLIARVKFHFAFKARRKKIPTKIETYHCNSK